MSKWSKYVNGVTYAIKRSSNSNMIDEHWWKLWINDNEKTQETTNQE